MDGLSPPMVPAASPRWRSARRWAALGGFGYTSATNAFLFMDFSTTAAISQSVLHIDESSLKWLYSFALLSVALGAPVASWGLVRYNTLTNLAGVLLNLTAAWIRFAAISADSYRLALLSSLLTGLSSPRTPPPPAPPNPNPNPHPTPTHPPTRQVSRPPW